MPSGACGNALMLRAARLQTAITHSSCCEAPAAVLTPIHLCRCSRQAPEGEGSRPAGHCAAAVPAWWVHCEFRFTRLCITTVVKGILDDANAYWLSNLHRDSPLRCTGASVLQKKPHQSTQSGGSLHAAEESRGGAKDMLETGALDGIDGIAGIHVWPDTPSGTITTKANPTQCIHCIPLPFV